MTMIFLADNINITTKKVGFQCYDSVGLVTGKTFGL